MGIDKSYQSFTVTVCGLHPTSSSQTSSLVDIF